MQGKYYLKNELFLLGELHLTYGGTTANKRNAWNIEKSHSNDTICIGCKDIHMKPDTVNVQEYTIKPIRHKKKANTTSMGFELGDYVELEIRSNKLKKKIKVKGYITAFIKCQNGKDKRKLTYINLTAINLTADDGTIYKRYSLKKCKLLEKQKHLRFME